MDSINDADGALFAIILEQGTGPLTERLIKLSDYIDTTRESVFNLDNAKAVQDLNLADSQLSFITEVLPSATTTEIEEPTFAEEQQLQAPVNETEIIPSTITESMVGEEPIPLPLQQEEPTINTRIPLNKTQQELVTVEQVGGLNITTHEKTTVTIVEGNKTTHREIITTEVPLSQK